MFLIDESKFRSTKNGIKPQIIRIPLLQTSQFLASQSFFFKLRNDFETFFQFYYDTIYPSS